MMTIRDEILIRKLDDGRMYAEFHLAETGSRPAMTKSWIGSETVTIGELASGFDKQPIPTLADVVAE